MSPLHCFDKASTNNSNALESLQFYSDHGRSIIVRVKMSDRVTEEKVYLIKCFFSKDEIYGAVYRAFWAYRARSQTWLWAL